MTVRIQPKIRWVAGDRNGVAHAFKKPGLLRAECGHYTINERFAWPELSRCPKCLEKMGEMV
ncbi:MAG: hypothetical protein ACRDGQ_01725 [Candidatus Limnocylindrales bacterium]